jgi:hypothetical protein
MRVFISHSSQDQETADRFRTLLTQKGFEVWDPDRQLLPGSNWLIETGRALENADAVVFLLSPDSSRSALRYEVEYVIGRPKYENRVIPVRLSREGGKFPWILSKLSVIDASNESPEKVAERIATRLGSARTRKAAVAKRMSLPRAEIQDKTAKLSKRRA